MEAIRASGHKKSLAGGAEMSQEDRKQSRSSKKAVRRKARRQAEAAQKLVSKLNPGLWNKYDTVKMMRDIQGAKAVTTATGARNQVGGNYSTSAKFFSQLQEPVTASVKSAGHGGRCQGHKQESSSTEVMSQRQGGLPRRVVLF